MDNTLRHTADTPAPPSPPPRAPQPPAPNAQRPRMNPSANANRITYLVLLALLLAAPAIGLYPVFVMKLLCFALFACAFNLLLGFTGLLSFGHAAFFGSAAYITGWFVKAQNWTP